MVVTSCMRFDLLEKTLESFFRHNTYPISQILIAEDSAEEAALNRMLRKFPGQPFRLQINGKQIGQARSIDTAYGQVQTEYIFHCEDDWEFYRPGFIEESLALMEADPSLLTAWLEPPAAFPDYLFEPEVQTQNGVSFRKVKEEGFTFRPGLKRLSHYHLIGSYAPYVGPAFEKDISDFYTRSGHYGVILTEGYMRNLGHHRRVHFSGKSNPFLALDNQFKRLKAVFYKALRIGKFRAEG